MISNDLKMKKTLFLCTIALTLGFRAYAQTETDSTNNTGNGCLKWLSVPDSAIDFDGFTKKNLAAMPDWDRLSKEYSVFSDAMFEKYEKTTYDSVPTEIALTCCELYKKAYGISSEDPCKLRPLRNMI